MFSWQHYLVGNYQISPQSSVYHNLAHMAMEVQRVALCNMYTGKVEYIHSLAASRCI